MSNILDNISLKYNWWTTINDKKNISEYIKISYVFSSGNIYEIANIFKNYNYNILLKAFKYIEKDNFLLKSKRKKVLLHLLILKQNGDI